MADEKDGVQLQISELKQSLKDSFRSEDQEIRSSLNRIEIDLREYARKEGDSAKRVAFGYLTLVAGVLALAGYFSLQELISQRFSRSLLADYEARAAQSAKDALDSATEASSVAQSTATVFFEQHKGEAEIAVEEIQRRTSSADQILSKIADMEKEVANQLSRAKISANSAANSAKDSVQAALSGYTREIQDAVVRANSDAAEVKELLEEFEKKVASLSSIIMQMETLRESIDGNREGLNRIFNNLELSGTTCGKAIVWKQCNTRHCGDRENDIYSLVRYVQPTIVQPNVSVSLIAKEGSSWKDKTEVDVVNSNYEGFTVLLRKTDVTKAYSRTANANDVCFKWTASSKAP